MSVRDSSANAGDQAVPSAEHEVVEELGPGEWSATGHSWPQRCAVEWSLACQGDLLAQAKRQARERDAAGRLNAAMTTDDEEPLQASQSEDDWSARADCVDEAPGSTADASFAPSDKSLVGPWSTTCVALPGLGLGGFPVSLRTAAGAIVVRLGGWEQHFVVEDEDDDDAARSAVDLFVAALIGEIELRVLARGKVEVAWQARVLNPRIVELPWQGHRTWLSRLGKSRSLRNEYRRPRHLARRKLSVVPPWAPWLGAAGELISASAQEKTIQLETGLAIDGVLDLHPFRPKDVRALMDAYLDACLERGIYEVRIIHGKGKGVLRRMVHSILGKDPRVISFRLGGEGAGQWGATVANLKPLAVDAQRSSPKV